MLNNPNGSVESMGLFKTLVTILVMISVTFVAETTAQTQTPPAEQKPEKIVKGQVRSIDPAGTSITLMDGTRLLAPPGAALRPGALTEGMTIIASYREENGAKVLTELAMDEPSASPRSPTEPLPGPPRDSPKRY
jgi:hypothetical protein